MLKVASFILIIVLIYAGLFSLMNIIAPRFMMGDTVVTLIGIAPENPEKAEVMKSLEFGQRIMGGAGLVIVIFGFAVLFVGFWRAKRWAWWIFLFAGCILWIFSLIYPLWGLIYQGVLIAVRSNIILQAIAIAVLLIALFIPIRSFSKKE